MKRGVLRWGHLVRHGLLGASLVGAATPANAAPCVERIYDDVRSVNLEETWVGFTIGLDVWPKRAFNGGIEVRRCLATNVDGVVRFEIGMSGARLVAGVHSRLFANGTPIGKNELEDDVGVEATVGVDFGGSFIAQVAAMYTPEYASLRTQGTFAFPSRKKVVLPSRASVLLGVSPKAWQDPPGLGRPVRVARQPVVPDVVALGDARCAEDRVVRDHFARSAQLEYSSVWTFLRLAAELAAVGAPSELVARALDAADDEVRHAEMCAHAAGGLALAQLAMSAAQPRFTRRSTRALATIAAEAWTEGCLNEGAAAEEARLASADAHGPARSLLAAIARDEAGHADLAHDVLAWVNLVAPDVARTAIVVEPENLGANSSVEAVEDRALAHRGVARSEVRRSAVRHARHVAIERVRSVTTG